MTESLCFQCLARSVKKKVTEKCRKDLRGALEYVDCAPPHPPRGAQNETN